MTYYWNLWTHLEHEKQQEFWFEITFKEIIDGKDNRWCGRQVWKTQIQYQEMSVKILKQIFSAFFLFWLF